jgi:hypothetical protein
MAKMCIVIFVCFVSTVIYTQPWKENEYTKRLLFFIVVNCMGMMWCSYILISLGFEEAALTLSETITKTCVAIVIPSLLKFTVENLSKNNSWPDKPCCTDKTASGNDP